MKIIKLNQDELVFDNGMIISYDHCQSCCEHNYADFKQIEQLALNTNFDENLIFEAVQDSGFRFGNPNKMFFIPCYSEQNGCYTTEIDIYYNGKKVLSFNAEFI